MMLCSCNASAKRPANTRGVTNVVQIDITFLIVVTQEVKEDFYVLYLQVED
jgi:hypothetical protein